MKIQASITIPYAVANYAEMRDRGFYYVDKTDYIPRLEAYKAPVFLRPRRFGKSLLVSTLAHYYDRTLAHRFEDLFGGTYIGSHPTPEHNRYMIIRYDFSAMVMADNMEGLEQNFNILNCSPVEIMVIHNRDLFGDFQFTARGNAAQMLEEALAYARAHDLPPVYILIDEYDNFTNQLLTSYNDPLYEKVTTADSFLRTFFKVIKKGIGEGSIRTCFCTGVLPVTMDDLTSGYNIAEILTLHPDFIKMLGFTHAEADAYLRYVLDKYTGSQERYDEIWQLIVNNYDGYRFSPKGEKLFNATILTYFLKNFATRHGEVPEEMIDENLRTDIGWLRRLTLSLENSKAMLDALVIDNGL
ncbi:ATP-binding protein, partial [Bacteroides salyersiae]|uniref:ATP-binding protein n=1 Tax=Bacteroides salyersiae TaxID=291644 RepID=UPI001C8B60FA